jgi:hypothetical protein
MRRALVLGHMRVEGGKQAAPAQQTQKAGGGEENLKDFPKQQSLINVLRNPEMRKKLEAKVGEELVAKLDKIFNAQPPGVSPVQQQQAQAQGPEAAQGPQGPQAQAER